jgi:hypothetical protein
MSPDDFQVHNPFETPSMADPGRPYVDGKPLAPPATSAEPPPADAPPPRPKRSRAPAGTPKAAKAPNK